MVVNPSCIFADFQMVGTSHMGIQIFECGLYIGLSIILVRLSCSADMSITVYIARLVNLGDGRLIFELSLLFRG